MRFGRVDELAGSRNDDFWFRGRDGGNRSRRNTLIYRNIPPLCQWNAAHGASVGGAWVGGVRGAARPAAGPGPWGGRVGSVGRRVRFGGREELVAHLGGVEVAENLGAVACDVFRRRGARVEPGAWGEGASLATLAAEFGPSRDAVVRKAKRLGLAARTRLGLGARRYCNAWPEEQIAQLRTRWAAGVSLTLLAAELGRSGQTIANKAKRLGLPARRWSAPRDHGGDAAGPGGCPAAAPGRRHGSGPVGAIRPPGQAIPFGSACGLCKEATSFVLAIDGSPNTQCGPRLSPCGLGSFHGEQSTLADNKLPDIRTLDITRFTELVQDELSMFVAVAPVLSG